MKFSIITLFPELYEPFLATSLISRAQEKGVVSFKVDTLFSQCQLKERVDAPTFGHGSGMLLRPEVMERAITACEASQGPAFKIFFSPAGKKLDQDLLRSIYQRVQEKKHVMLLPARYEGMDARVEQTYADEIISLGDFVLMGGDLPAMVFLEGFLRLIPGVVGRQESVERDSFVGPFVDFPEYTAPVVWKGIEVPEVIRSGDHERMRQWRENQAIERTVFGHFDWLRQHHTSDEQNEKILATIPTHYAVLMHDQVLLPGEITPESTQGARGARVGTTSITSLDIHDIARSAKTYGLRGYFLVTPLEDQRKIASKLLHFWQEGVGITYNPHRHEALSSVHIRSSLQEVCRMIEEKEGAKPLVVATSAQLPTSPEGRANVISYGDQSQVWEQRRPVLLVFGTGRGLAPHIVEGADFILAPLEGYAPFNHLSVRSAAAVIFDRWLGINLRKDEVGKRS